MNKPNKKRSMPKWAREIFKQFIDEANQLLQTLNICAMGISIVRGAPKAIEVLMKLEEDDSDDVQEKLKRAKDASLLAESEVKEGFPVLNSWAVVTLWALLEGMVRSFVAEYIRRRRSSWSLPQLKKLRIRLGEYETILKEDRYLYVADLLEKEVAAGVRNGVNRFETLLAPFNLDGDVPKNTSKLIFELGQMRNTIVHRAGKADNQLLKSCPWLKQMRSEPVRITPKMMHKYFNAVDMYVTIVMCRVQETHGHNMSKEIGEIYESDRKLVS